MLEFNHVAWALSEHIKDSRALMRATEAIMAMLPKEPITSPDKIAVWNNSQWEFGHEKLVNKALKDPDVTYEVEANRKIAAIKLLRDRTGCGLKAAKDAIEDSRVWGYANTDDPKESLDALRAKLTNKQEEDSW